MTEQTPPGRLYPQRPLIGVGAVVCRGNQVLLIRRGTPPRIGEWSLPGGAQRLGETVFEAAVREVAEEAGVAIAVLGMIDVIDMIDRDEQGRIRFHYTLIDVAARWQAGEPRAAGDASDAAWMDVDCLDGLGMWHETLRVIRLGHRRCRETA
jgi:ADP-ribose pyrophosphatase YjhB (NUDIX family)